MKIPLIVVQTQTPPTAFLQNGDIQAKNVVDVRAYRPANGTEAYKEFAEISARMQKRCDVDHTPMDKRIHIEGDRHEGYEKDIIWSCSRSMPDIILTYMEIDTNNIDTKKPAGKASADDMKWVQQQMSAQTDALNSIAKSMKKMATLEQNLGGMMLGTMNI